MEKIEQFLLFSTIFCYLLLSFHVNTETNILLRDRRLFETSEVEITRVDCIIKSYGLQSSAQEGYRGKIEPVHDQTYNKTCATKERKKERKKYFRQRESIEQYMSRNVRINTFGHMSPVKVQIRLRIRAV